MNQSLYFEMSHKGLVSDEAGNIKIVEADSKSEEDSIQKVLEYENEIERLEKTIESDQDSLDKEKYLTKLCKPVLVLSIITYGIVFSIFGMLLKFTFVPILCFTGGTALYFYLNNYLNKNVHNKEDNISRNIKRLSKLEEDCSNYKSKCNYKVIEPCESVRYNDYTYEFYDVSIHGGENTFDKPSGKVLSLTREIKRN